MQLAQIISKDHTHLDDPGFSSLLDAARWIAALCVVTTHASWRILLPISEQHDSSLLTKLFYLSNSFGHVAVIIFFVLSGYLVGGKGTVAAARGTFNLIDYSSARIARLYAVLLPALVLTAVADGVSNHLTSGTGFQVASGYNNLNCWTGYINVLMLQRFYGPTFGSNTPLWSLSYEFWFYVMFALAVQATTRRASRLWWVGVATALVIFLGTNFVQYSLIWILGLVAAVIPRRSGGKATVTVAIIVFIAGLSAARLLEDALTRFGADLLQSVATGGLLWAFKGNELGLMKRVKSINTFLASFSYSLYAVHYPLLLLFLTLIGGPASSGGYSMRLELDLASVSLFVSAVGACMVTSWLFSLLTEQKTNTLRKRLRYSL